MQNFAKFQAQSHQNEAQQDYSTNDQGNVYLWLNPKKCVLCQQRVNFLGHVISSEVVATDLENVIAVRELNSNSS